MDMVMAQVAGVDTLGPLAQYGALGTICGALLWYTLSQGARRDQEAREGARQREERLVEIIQAVTPELRALGELLKAATSTLCTIAEQQRAMCEDLRELRDEVRRGRRTA
jgi:hypothetical protein